MAFLLKLEHQCVICNVIASAFAVLVAGPLTWWAIDREPAYTAAPGSVLPDPAKPGEPLDLLRVITVNREGCSAYFNREIKDSTTFVWTYPISQATFVGLPIGTHHTHSVHPFKLPMGAADGDATVTSNIWSICNPIQRLFPVHFRSEPEHFMIKRDPTDRIGPKGDTGAQGEQGEQGDKGDRGAKGRPGEDTR